MIKPNKNYEGFFITIEGGEGSGKSTLAASLSDSLNTKGYPVVKVREPGGTKLSKYIRNLLLTPHKEIKIGELSELLLFLTARAEHIEEVIMPALRKGHVVVCERFNDSSIAYQGAARHLGMQYVEKLCHLVTNGLEPDFTFLLDLSPEEGLRRFAGKKDFDRLEQEEIQFHREVRQGYLHLADQYSSRIKILDASTPADTILSEALKILSEQMGSKQRT